MSSTYRFMCLAHDPAIFVEPWETQSRDEAVGLAERRAEATQLAEHRICPLVIGRFSYPLVEAYCLDSKRWADADLLRLILAAYQADVPQDRLAPFARQGWTLDVLALLKPHLGLGS